MIAPGDLLGFANDGDLPAQPEAELRRRISAAYYAAFHAIAEAGSELFRGSATARQRLARSYDHTAVRSMAAEMARHGKERQADPGYAVIASSLVLLWEARQQADYDLRADLTWVDAVDSFVLADGLIAAVSRLKSDPTFAEFLLLPLVRDRGRRG